MNITAVGSGVGAAACWGAADFGGGYAARGATPLAAVVVSQTTSLIVALAILAVVGEQLPAPRALAWAGLAGASGLMALVFLYRALATRAMGPVSAIATLVGVAVPVVIGVLTGDRLRASDIAGMGCAIVAIAMVTRPSGAIRIGRDGVALALLSGIGAGGFFVCMGQSSDAGGATWWPVIAGRTTSVLLAIGLTTVLRQVASTARSASPLMALIGVVDMVGVMFFLVASAQGPLGVAVVLSSQYPAVTMLFARVVLHQRLAPIQMAGMVVALIGIGLIALP